MRHFLQSHGLLILMLSAPYAGCMASDSMDMQGNEPDTGPEIDTGLPNPDWQDPRGPSQDSELEGPQGTDSQCQWPSGTYFLSSDDSNSMASPVLARAFIEAGQRVPRESVRIHEFLNYYDLGLPRGKGDALGLTMAMRPSDTPQEHELLVGVSAPEPSPTSRRQLALTLSIDTSSSMAGAPLSIARSACQTLARSLEDGDLLSIVTWSTTQNVLLDSWAVSKKNTEQGEPLDPQVELMCSQLQAGGATNLHLGLVAAIELADRNAGAQRTNRIILLSDGRANAGFAEISTIAKRAARSTGGQVLFMGAGVGRAESYRDQLMNLVTDAGKGAYVFLDSEAEARKIFGEQLLRHVDIAARDVSVALSLPYGLGISRFHGEEYSQAPGVVEPQHLAADDAMAFHQVLGSCGEPGPDLLSQNATVTVDYEDPLSGSSRTATLSLTVAELFAQVESASLSKAGAVVAWAKLLKDLPDNAAQAISRIDAVRARMAQAMALAEDDSELKEIDGLLVRLRAIVQ
jgi:Ca-activated chloride channel family protein